LETVLDLVLEHRVPDGGGAPHVTEDLASGISGGSHLWEPWHQVQDCGGVNATNRLVAVIKAVAVFRATL